MSARAVLDAKTLVVVDEAKTDGTATAAFAEQEAVEQVAAAQAAQARAEARAEAAEAALETARIQVRAEFADNSGAPTAPSQADKDTLGQAEPVHSDVASSSDAVPTALAVDEAAASHEPAFTVAVDEAVSAQLAPFLALLDEHCPAASTSTQTKAGVSTSQAGNMFDSLKHNVALSKVASTDVGVRAKALTQKMGSLFSGFSLDEALQKKQHDGSAAGSDGDDGEGAGAEERAQAATELTAETEGGGAEGGPPAEPASIDVLMARLQQLVDDHTALKQSKGKISFFSTSKPVADSVPGKAAGDSSRVTELTEQLGNYKERAAEFEQEAEGALRKQRRIAAAHKRCL